MRARNLVSDVKPQPETRTLVRIHVCLRMDSTSQRIEDGASFPLRNCWSAIEDANGDTFRLFSVEGDVHRGAAIPVLDRIANEIRDKLLDARCIRLASAISVAAD